MKRYRWNYKKCAKNLGLLALRLLACLALCLFLGLSSIG